MKNVKATRRYALALHDAAVDLDCLEMVGSDLESLGSVLKTSQNLRGFLSDYAIGRPRRAMALKALFADRVCELTWRFVRFLEERKRLGLLPDISLVFPDVRRVMAGRLEGVVYAAFPMDRAFEWAVFERFERMWGKSIGFSSVRDSTLIGGLRVRVEDVLYDMSIRGLLLRLQGRTDF